MLAGDATGKADYWDHYYADGATEVVRPVPSQFAAFVAGELRGRFRVVEFGCGNGRDALFFASYGHQVTAVDGSASAIARATATADALGEKVEFVTAPIDDPTLPGLVPAGTEPTIVYARFFLHAVTDEEEAAFLACAAALTAPGDLMAVEYRTVRDQSQTKETASHYRRFLSPAEFQVSAARHGFQVAYAVEGFGFAKYKHDDAYVARSLLERV